MYVVKSIDDPHTAAALGRTAHGRLHMLPITTTSITTTTTTTTPYQISQNNSGTTV